MMSNWVVLAHISTIQSMTCPLTNPGYCMNLFDSQFEYSVTPRLTVHSPSGKETHLLTRVRFPQVILLCSRLLCCLMGSYLVGCESFIGC